MMLESAKSMIFEIKQSSLTKIVEFTSQNRGIYGYVRYFNENRCRVGCPKFGRFFSNLI
jgi:hypothetical protein